MDQKPVREFENLMCEYTAAPYAVAVDCCTHAIELSLRWSMIKDRSIHAVHVPFGVFRTVLMCLDNLKIIPLFERGYKLDDPYYLNPAPVLDSAMELSEKMYTRVLPGTLVCISFTGDEKPIDLGKGGMILLDDERASEWLRNATFSGGMGEMKQDFGRRYFMSPILAQVGIERLKEIMKR